MFLGPYTEQVVDEAGHRFVAWSTDVTPVPDGAVWLGVDPVRVLVLPADDGDSDDAGGDRR